MWCFFYFCMNNFFSFITFISFGMIVFYFFKH